MFRVELRFGWLMTCSQGSALVSTIRKGEVWVCARAQSICFCPHSGQYSCPFLSSCPQFVHRIAIETAGFDSLSVAGTGAGGSDGVSVTSADGGVGGGGGGGFTVAGPRLFLIHNSTPATTATAAMAPTIM